MSDSTTTTQKELLNIQNNVQETENSKDSTMTGNIPNSPLHWIRKEDGLHVAMGKYRLNDHPMNWYGIEEMRPTDEEMAIEYVKREMWNILLKIVMIATSDVIEASKRQEDTKKIG
ncbi:MAG: hypothetical protein [Microviridae sp.]|nr:MAG: hypothetical protein [Microviridae sp.]